VLAAILIASTGVKFALFLSAGRIMFGGDEKQYLAAAVSIVEQGIPIYRTPVWDEAHASPLIPYFLAACYRVFGAESFADCARSIQILLSGVSVWLLYLIARRFLDRRTALLSAGVAAFYPALIGFSHFFYSETIYIFLVLACAAVLIRRKAELGWGAAFAAGLLGGFASLTRSVFVMQMPFVILWIWFAARCCAWSRRIAVCAAFAVGMALVITPWTIRNTLRYGHFMLIDSNGGNVLYKNWNALKPENHDYGLTTRWRIEEVAYVGRIPLRARSAEENIAVRNSAEIHAALAFVLRYPGRFLRNCGIRAVELFNPTSFVVRKVRFNGYKRLTPFWRETIVYANLFSAMAVMLFGIFGIVSRRLSLASALALLLIVANTAICILIISGSRYRLPMMPLLIPFAADGFLRMPELLMFRHHGKTWIAALPLIAFVVCCWVVYVPYSFPN